MATFRTLQVRDGSGPDGIIQNTFFWEKRPPALPLARSEWGGFVVDRSRLLPPPNRNNPRPTGH